MYIVYVLKLKSFYLSIYWLVKYNINGIRESLCESNLAVCALNISGRRQTLGLHSYVTTYYYTTM